MGGSRLRVVKEQTKFNQAIKMAPSIDTVGQTESTSLSRFVEVSSSVINS